LLNFGWLWLQKEDGKSIQHQWCGILQSLKFQFLHHPGLFVNLKLISDYFGQRYSEFVGETLAGVLWMAVLVPLQASLLTLSFPFTGMMMIKIALLIVIGSLLKTTHEFTIGVLACWIGEATPVWWVYQKLLFTLGGLMIPLQFYPDTMREIAYWLPFSPIVNGPASLLLDPGAFTDVFVRLLLWSLASFGLAYIMVKLAMKKITIQGS
jgi:ABC-2 type transport system permease protein